MKYLDDLTLDQLSGLVRTLRQNQCAIATSWSYAQLNSGQWEHIYDVDDPSWQDGIPGGLRVPRLIASCKQARTEIASGSKTSAKNGPKNGRSHATPKRRITSDTSMATTRVALRRSRGWAANHGAPTSKVSVPIA